MMARSILAEGRNCWRRPIARRVAFLVDAADYYAAFAAAAERAERSIRILAWDVNSRTPLRPGDDGAPPLELGAFVHDLLERKPDLHVHVLTWDFIIFYASDRERRSAGRLGPGLHPRLHFHFDGDHPKLGCHHQKIVVVDDAVAFAGGIDFAAARWDTSKHRPDEPLRMDVKGAVGPPFHDLMMAVDAEAAAALGELARERWRRATGEQLPPVAASADPWPAQVRPDLEDVRVAISRTEPAHGGRQEVREVEALNLDAIRSAERILYVENQYFTADRVGDALAERLSAPHGPEIVIVLPRRFTDWLEASTVGVLRARLIRRLRHTDRFDRLRICHPILPGLGERHVKVHSKVLFADDRFLRIGSSNLSNRSLGVDTECDLSIESEGEARVERAIGGLRDRLVGEHLARSPAEVSQAVARRGSLVATIDELGGAERTLRPLECGPDGWIEGLLSDLEWIDPARPIELALGWRSRLRESSTGAVSASALRALLAIVVCVGLIIAWQATPLGKWAEPAALAHVARSIRGQPGLPLLVLGAYVLGTLAMLPVNILILATALTFGPLESFAYAFVGCMLGGVASYAAGRVLGRDALDRYGGKAIGGLNQRFARRGVLAIAALRLLPVAPFGLVNLMAGASAIGFRDYTIGTAIGMSPGILAITLFGRQLQHAIRRPGLASFALVGVVVLALAAASFGVDRWARKSEQMRKVG
jgi:phosphatidylserine/phosphatidylglycerophosphate/cardiolipin synthase-like enzyme/uncharacterized membrane protein YdjX (TVP38/TMEM64 family)